MITPATPKPLSPIPSPPARFFESTGLMLAMLCGITLAFYQNLWWPGLVLIKRDAFRFFLPIKHYLIERLAAGELPQWFPYEALGRPFIGVAHTGVFHPFTALYFLFPVQDAYRASTLLSCLLAALGAFALGRTLRYSRAGALVAGLAFALSGYVVSLTEHITYLYSICALPLFCAGLEKAFREHHGWVVAPALIWATVFLNGDIQTGYYFGFIALAWMAARASVAYRPALLRLGLVIGLTILLAAIQLGPSWAVFTGSDRTESASLHEQALSWSTHPLRLITLLASPVRENADPVELARFFFGSPKFGVWSESLYLGLPVVVLALLGAWHRRDLRLLAFLGSVSLLLALGKYGGLYEVFYHMVPLWSVFRYPEKIMGLASFAIAMLAGAGVDAVREGKAGTVPWCVAAALCAAAWLGFSTDAATAWTIAHFQAPAPLTGEVTHSTALAFAWSGIEAGGLALAVLAMRKHWMHATGLLVMLTLVVTFDLSRVNHPVYRTAPAEVATFTPAFVEAIASREGAIAPGRFRLLSLRNPTYVSPKSLRRLLGHDADIVERRQALDLEHNAQFHLETVFDYLPGSSAAFSTILGQYPGTAVAARFNVAYYIGRTSLVTDPRQAQTLIAVLRDYDLALFKNPDPVKPRAYLARQPEHTPTPADPAALIKRPDFLNGDVDVLEAAAGPVPGPAETGTAHIERYAPEEVRVRVETPQSAALVLLDAYDQGWTAALEDGSALPILRANALARAVVVPAGAHVVTFSYRTPLLTAGAWTSLAGILLCVGLVIHARRRPTDGQPD